MEARFNVQKEERKVLVKVVGDILGITPKYQGAPSFAYVVGDYTIDKDGTLTCGDEVTGGDIHHLMVELSTQGFTYEDDNGAICGDEQSDESAVDSNHYTDDDAVADTLADELNSDVPFGQLRSVVDDDGLFLTIEVPLDGFTETALENLNKLISGRALLIKKALGYEDADTDLTAVQTGDTLRFPWFPKVSSHDEVNAYSLFVQMLCNRAKTQKRVTIREKEQDANASEKFAFRCFLLQLKLIGKEYGTARKIPLSKLSGNGSFKYSKSSADEAHTDDAPSVDDGQGGGQEDE